MWTTLLRWAGANKLVLGAIAVVVALGALGFGIWKIREAGYDAGAAAVQARWDEQVREDEAQARRDERLVQRAVDAIGTRLSADLSQLRVTNTTINRRIVDEVRQVPVYSECRLTDSVWHDLNKLRAATSAGPAGGSGTAVPAPAADR
jgi:uncharacterized protein HemX